MAWEEGDRAVCEQKGGPRTNAFTEPFFNRMVRDLPSPLPNPPYVSFKWTNLMSTSRPTAVLVIKRSGSTKPDTAGLAPMSSSSPNQSRPRKKLADPEKWKLPEGPLN